MSRSYLIETARGRKVVTAEDLEAGGLPAEYITAAYARELEVQFEHLRSTVETLRDLCGQVGGVVTLRRTLGSFAAELEEHAERVANRVQFAKNDAKLV